MTEAILSMFSATGPLVANHIWQSTVFAVLAALLTLALRKNRASTRYWVWFAASVKFLIPFAALVRLGSELGWSFAPAKAPAFYWFLDLSAERAADVTHRLDVVQNAASGLWIPALVVMVWFAGFAALLAKWRRDWRQANFAVQHATVLRTGPEWQALRQLQDQTDIRTPVKLAASQASYEPGVFGIYQPVLLLPEAILDHLTAEQLEAILAHELSHIQRRDNLASAIHRVIQAIFWFHPIVWWLGQRLLNERERACDEFVLQLGSEPRTYSEGILRICRFCLETPDRCVSGVTSADLKKRIERIMTREVGRGLNQARKALLAAAALMAIGGPIATGLLYAPRSSAQSRPGGAALPSFAFATIKPSSPETRMKVDFAPGGRLVVTHATLRFLIKIAYDLGDSQIIGGPAWLSSKRFDVEAKPVAPIGGDPKNMTGDQRRVFQEQIRLRLQSLLADRFELKLSNTSKELPVYAMVVGKNGPKMQVSTGAGAPGMSFGHGELTASRVNMEMLARFLSEGQTGRPVIDMTELQGSYDFKLQWSPDQGQTLGTGDAASSQPVPADTAGLSIFTALQQQLGLKLDARKKPADCVVVEHAEIPSGN